MNHERFAAQTPRLIAALAVLLLLLAGWNVWRLGMLIRATRAAAAQAMSEFSAMPALSPQQAWQRLLSAHLFGKPVLGSAPPTTLPLKLEGVWADASGRGYAIIAADTSPAKVYAQGAALPYGASLRRVLATGVLLNTEAGLQSLALIKHAGGAAQGDAELAPTAEPATLANAPQRPGPRAPLPEASGAPLQIGDIARGTPIERDGHLAGYVLSPGTNASMFARLGLRPGDVLVSINGQPLGDAALSSAQWREALLRGNAQIVVERNGQTINLSPQPKLR
ncbi:MAG: PDZ domain-containing protein [Metallibacterium scheffleri]|jgi:general secretion pathway protein C|uniref:type II secretion system protein N n=1 Tax=Metallibacterium scheffleri TaxID=993689 RepID=UPI0026EADB70|nr:type II secretion system protein N [Metallibacterium scheffleri]MCK9367516.1 PDZ domain-containing protein [Metallibacterium scheffleri]